MGFYLIENMMGFEHPMEEGTERDMALKREKHEEEPATRRVGSGSNEFTIKASYYVVPKGDWDIQHCPLIPVDLS